MKKSLTAILGIMLFVVLGCNMLGTKEADDKIATPSDSDSTSDTAKESSSDSKDSSSSGDITYDKFKQLKFGMSYDEVKEVMGSDGEETRSSQVGQYESKTYAWKGDKFERISASFRNDELRFLSQSGLTGNSGDAAITKAKFDQVKTGMTYDEVKDVIGSEGEMTSMSKIGDSTLASYVWKGERFANMRATFKDEKMTSKSQSNLK